MNERVVTCRAQLVDECDNGRTEEAVYDTTESGNTMDDDGTWDGNSVVCNACYLAVMPFTRSGSALASELPEAIGHYRHQRDYLRGHDDPEKLRLEAESAALQSRPGSARETSARALAAMAAAEVRRREQVGT